MVKLDAKKLRESEPTKEDLAKIKRQNVYIVCDNILDTYNIGSIFRLADAVAAKKIYLCGKEVATPPYHRIAKASVGTYKWVPWEYKLKTKDAILDLRKKVKDIKVVAIEQSKESIDYRKMDYSGPIAFVLGHETTGVDEKILKICDEVVEIPMFGVNISLNVMVSLAIVLYKSVEKNKTS